MSDQRPPIRPTEEDGRLSLRDHALERAARARVALGPPTDAARFARLLSDRSLVRYPTSVLFDATHLEPDEFAWAMPLGDHPKDGFVIVIHPRFQGRPELWPLLAAYHLPTINYGEIVDAETCEAFGAELFGMEVNAYYAKLVLAADEIRSTDP